MTVPYIFATASGNVPLAELDANFASVANNVSSANVSGTVTINAQPNITSVGTLTSLSVTGNVNAGNIIATNLSGPIFLAYQSTPQSLSTGITDLIYNTATVNSSSYYNPVTGIFTPLVPGYYQVNATIFPAFIFGTANAGFFLNVYKNGVLLAQGPGCTITPAGGITAGSAISVLVPFNGTTDYISCKINSTIVSGTWTTAAVTSTYFQACWVRGI